MPKIALPLTDAAITGAKHDASKKTQYLTDGGRQLKLKLRFDVNGKRVAAGHQWLFTYRRPETNLRNDYLIGTYPAMSLSDARKVALEHVRKMQMDDSYDPASKRNEAEDKANAESAQLLLNAQRKKDGMAPYGTFLGVAHDLVKDRGESGMWSELYCYQWKRMVERCLPEKLAAMPIADVKAEHVRNDVIKPLEKAEKDATAITVRKYLVELFDYAERLEHRAGNPARLIRKDCKSARHSTKLGNNPAALKRDELAHVLNKIARWEHGPTGKVTKQALQIHIALAQRPGDLCAMRWADVDLDAGIWMVPAPPRSKLYNSLGGAAHHVVPMPRQVVSMLREIKAGAGNSEWVFQSQIGGCGAISNDTLSNALRRMGLGDKQSPHGFRATFRTVAAVELKLPQQYLEAQLAHSIGMQKLDDTVVRDTLGSAYWRATFVDERRAVVQAWADYLDSLVEPVAESLPAAPLALAA